MYLSRLISSSLDAAGVFPSSSAVCNNYCPILLTVQFIRSIIIMTFKEHDMCVGCVSCFEECDKVTVELVRKKMVHGKLDATIPSEMEGGREGRREAGREQWHLILYCFFYLSYRPPNPSTSGQLIGWHCAIQVKIC